MSVKMCSWNNCFTIYDLSDYIECFSLAQDKLIPNSAWKDYSANTNYAFDTVDAPEDKQKRGSRVNTSSSSQQTLPLSHAPMKAQYYSADKSRHSHYENGHGNGHSHRYANGNNDYYQGRGGEAAHPSYADRTYSLPRTAAYSQRHSQPSHHDGYYTQDRRSRNPRNSHHPQSHYNDEPRAGALDKPDFYFMPSQRKYSGEVVRVYVDYNKDSKK